MFGVTVYCVWFSLFVLGLVVFILCFGSLLLVDLMLLGFCFAAWMILVCSSKICVGCSWFVVLIMYWRLACSFGG